MIRCRKRLMIPVGLLLAAVMFLGRIYAEENCGTCCGNDQKCRKTAEFLGAKDGVCDVAVLYKDETVLTALFIDTPHADIKEVTLITEKFVSEVFENAKTIKTEVNSGEAADILELAYCADNRMPSRVLNKRFKALAEKN